MNFETDTFSWVDEATFPEGINLKKPSKYPCIILNLLISWNDFGIVNNFYAFYLKDSETPKVYLGRVKIISKKNWEQNRILEIPERFTSLPEEFISLGCSHEYYENLRDYLGEESFTICNDLRDVAIIEGLRKGYENNFFWSHSILRENESERMLRAANDILKRIDYRLKHRFIYNYIPSYNNKCQINFDFNLDNKFFPKRVISIIGKNGVGKTTLIKRLISDYVNTKSENFNDLLPKFSIPILVTTSSLDNYYFTNEEKKKFKHCSLLDDKNMPISEEVQISYIKAYLEDINSFDSKTNPIVRNALEVISKLLPQEKENIKIEVNTETKINISAITEIYKRSSSGVKSLLFIMISILSNIKTDSLLILDEPELHLHPNFIALFIYTIYKLVDEYSSYAIIATHSPIVIREMKADDVYIMEREEQECRIRQTKFETLGADLTEITDEVFNTKEIPLHFIETIEKMKEMNFSKEEIIKNIQSNKRELSLSVELYIESLFSDEDKYYEEYFN